MDYDTEILAEPEELDIEDGDSSYDDHSAATEIEINDNEADRSVEKENFRNSIRITKLQSDVNTNRNDSRKRRFEGRDGDAIEASIDLEKPPKDISKADLKDVVCWS